MNKLTITIGAFIVAVVLGVGALLFFAGDDEGQSERSTTEQGVNANGTSELAEAPTGEGYGEYVEYSETAIEEAEGQVVLFFHAVWCPQCVQLERDLKQNGVPEGYTFIQVDFDQNQELRQRYSVTVQTTLIQIDENGQEISRHVPYDEPTVEAVKRDFLEG